MKKYILFTLFVAFCIPLICIAGMNPYIAGSSGIVSSGTNIILNGDFADWTGDDPDNWTVVNEDGVDSYIDESAGGGEAHLVYAAGDAALQMYQAVMTNTVTYDYSITVTDITAHGIKLCNHDISQIVAIYSTGTHTGEFTANGTNFYIMRAASGSSADVTFDDVSLIAQ